MNNKIFTVKQFSYKKIKFYEIIFNSNWLHHNTAPNQHDVVCITITTADNQTTLRCVVLKLTTILLIFSTVRNRHLENFLYALLLSTSTMSTCSHPLASYYKFLRISAQLSNYLIKITHKHKNQCPKLKINKNNKFSPLANS